MSTPDPLARLAQSRTAFTLVEVLVVVVILGILAAVVTPQFSNAADDARRSAFISTLTTFSKSAEYFTHKSGLSIGDTSSGEAPTNGFEDFIDIAMWTQPTPIGGAWDTEEGLIGVHFDGTGDTRDAAYMTIIDTIFDNGDLTSGRFQQTAADRYYLLLSSY